MPSFLFGLPHIPLQLYEIKSIIMKFIFKPVILVLLALFIVSCKKTTKEGVVEIEENYVANNYDKQEASNN